MIAWGLGIICSSLVLISFSNAKSPDWEIRDFLNAGGLRGRWGRKDGVVGREAGL